MGRRNLVAEDIVRYEEDGPRVVLLDQRRLPDDEVWELEAAGIPHAVIDVTPADLIAAIVTEHGVHRAPYAQSLAALV